MADHQKQIDDFGKNDDFWLFGYGSLIWKPPPHYDQRVAGYIEGYVRRFWQASQDHRGTPEAPGRVVTLIDKSHWETLTDHHESTEKVWGAAYHIPREKVAEVREYLDIREINGYSIQFTPFHSASFTARVTSIASAQTPSEPQSFSWGNAIMASTTTTISSQPEPAPSSIQCLVYIGLPDNPQFLGPQDPDELARHILKSRGPSGENREYLFMLEKALLGLSADSGDAHISDLVRRCQEIEAGQAKANTIGGEETVGKDASEPLHKVGSTEEQEEVEK